jgi:hypothetical protein
MPAPPLIDRPNVIVSFRSGPDVQVHPLRRSSLTICGGRPELARLHGRPRSRTRLVQGLTFLLRQVVPFVVDHQIELGALGQLRRVGRSVIAHGSADRRPPRELADARARPTASRGHDAVEPARIAECGARGCRRRCCGTLVPHDRRRTCARLCHLAGGELDQIQFLLGHVSIQTTERYLGCNKSSGLP